MGQIFDKPLLARVEVVVRGQVVVLSELSALWRCRYLQEIAPDVSADEIDADDFDLPDPQPEQSLTFKEVWGAAADTVGAKMRLVAYSVAAAGEGDLDFVDRWHAELLAAVPNNEASQLYEAAAKLSNLWVESEGDEEPKKPDAPATDLPGS